MQTHLNKMDIFTINQQITALFNGVLDKSDLDFIRNAR